MKLQQAAGGEQAREVDLGYSPPAIPYFNGINARINIPYSGELNPASSFTVEMWVRFQGGKGYRAVLSSVSGSAKQGRRGYLFCVNLTGQWQLWVGTGQIGVPWVALTGSNAKVGVWTHLAATYDLESQTASLYVNGKLSAQRAGTPFLPNSGNPMHVGAGATEQPGASSCFFHGLITKVRIWNRALSNAELQLLAAPGTPDAAPPTIPPTPPPSGGGSGAGGPAAGAGGAASGTGGAPGAGGAGTGTTGTGTGTTGTGTGTTGTGAGTTGTGTGTTGTGTGTTGTGTGTTGTGTGTTGTGTGTGTGTTGSGTSTTGTGTGTGTTGSGTGMAGTGTGTAGAGAQTAQEKEKYLPQPVLAFDGKDDYVEVPYAASANPEQFTLFCWVKVEGGQGSWRSLITSRDISPTKGYMLYAGDNNCWQFWTGNGSAAGWTKVSGSQIALNTWTSVAATCDGSKMKLYVNGELVGETAAQYVANSARPLRIGSGTTEGKPGFFLPGQMSEVRVWDRVCTQEEIQRDAHKRLQGNEPGLVYYWALNEGSGTTAGDKGSNANHGTIYGATWQQAEVPISGTGTAGSATGSGTGTGTAGSGTATTGTGTGTAGSGTGTTGTGTGTTGTGTGTTGTATGQQSQTPSPSGPSTPPVKSLQSVLVFDGKDDFVEIKDPFENSTAFTISLWVKPSVLNDGAWHGIAGKRWGELCSKPGLWVAPDSSALTYDSYPPEGNPRYSDSLKNFFSALDEWVHITWVKEGTEYRFYRNGELFATKPAPETFYTAKTSYWLGRVDNFFAGEITEVSFWSVARTQEDIQKDMHRHLKGDEPGLTYYWAFSEGSGNTVHERVTRPKDGVIRGAVWQQAELPLPVPAHAPRAVAPVLAFDGVDDSVEVQDPFENNTTFSICLWVKPSVLDDGAYHGILGKSGDESRKPGLWVAPHNSALEYDSHTPAGKNRYSEVLSNFFTAVDQWVHIAWVKEGGEYRFYRNGELFATKPAPKTFYTAKTSYFIGRVDNFFAGQMAEVSVWSVARTQAEILNDMHRRNKGDEAGLAYYWAFNEGSGSTANDSGKNANHGTIHGATWQQAAVPVATAEPAPANSPPAVLEPVLAFDGTDDFVELQAKSVPSGNEITVSFWAYGDNSLPKNTSVINAADSANKLTLDIHLPVNTGAISFSCGGEFIRKVALFTDYRGKWSHWAFTKNATAGEMKIYLNGELFHSETGKTLPLAQTAKVLLGKKTEGTIFYYHGKLKDMSVWSRARSQDEIKADINRPLVGNEAGLVGYWPLNEGTGTAVSDRTSNANHGTINGATWQQAEGPLAPAKPAGKVLQPVLAFDGGDDYVETPDPFDSSTAFTISLWLYAINSIATKGMLGKGGEYRKPSLSLWPPSKVVYESASDPDGRNFKKMLDKFFEAQEQWVHITWVKEGTEYRLYRNGELFGTYPAPESFYRSSKTCYWIGRLTAGGDNFAGYMAEVNIWSVARTQADIQKDMRRRLQGDEPGLSYYLPLDEGRGTTAFDMANRPNHGKIIGATWQESEVPIASRQAAPKVPQTVQPVLAFDGRDDYVEIQNPFENSAAFTISLWLKPSAINSGTDCGILGKPWTQSCPPQLTMVGYDGALYFSYTEVGKGNYGANLANFFEAQHEWVHLTWVKEGKEFRIYRNGELFATRASAPENVYTEKGTYYIGRSSKFFAGQITGLSVWSVARTGEEIQKDVHRHLKGDEPGLAYYWPLNEGTGDTVLDKGKNANHGKIIGSTWQRVEVPIV